MNFPYRANIARWLFLCLLPALFFNLAAKSQGTVITDLVRAKKWKAAEKELQKYLPKNPDKEWVYSTYSWVLENLEDYDKAIQICETGLRKWPQSKRIKSALARAYHKKARKIRGKTPKEARELWIKANSIVKKDFILYQLAVSYREEGDFEKAIELLQEGAQLFPKTDYLLNALAYTRYLAAKDAIKQHDHARLRNYVSQAPEWVDPQLDIMKQMNYIYLIRYGLKELNEPDLFESIFAQMFKRFPRAAFIYDEYGSQLYANHRLHNPYDPAVKKRAIEYRRKAFRLYWKNHKKPEPIRDLPFPLKGHYEVWSSFGGTAMTHNGFANYCYDFAAVDSAGKLYKGKTKTLKNYYMYDQPIYAVLDGIVKYTYDDYPDNKIGGFSADANAITMDHGSFDSFYAHLRKGGSVVKEGQRVRQGQLIGYAGNSGMSSEPHLHFCLYNHESTRATIPYLFKKTVIKKPSGSTIESAGPYAERDIVLFR